MEFRHEIWVRYPLRTPGLLDTLSCLSPSVHDRGTSPPVYLVTLHSSLYDPFWKKLPPFFSASHSLSVVVKPIPLYDSPRPSLVVSPKDDTGGVMGSWEGRGEVDREFMSSDGCTVPGSDWTGRGDGR